MFYRVPNTPCVSEIYYMKYTNKNIQKCKMFKLLFLSIFNQHETRLHLRPILRCSEHNELVFKEIW